MSLKKNIIDVLRKHGIRPNKYLGQNFLINQSAITALVESADISKKDTIIEVGPGTGIITKELARRARHVIAVEKDERLIPLLQDELQEFNNVKIVHDDILKIQIVNGKWQMANGAGQGSKTLARGYKLVGAPPYYLTARLFRHFLEELENKPELIALIIQKEVARKIVAQPPRSNLLAISIQFYGKPRVEKIIRKGSFLPQPKVDSALLTVQDIQKPDVDERAFFALVKAGFSAPRKQLISNLARNFKTSRKETIQWLTDAGVEPSRRAQTLTLKEWKTLLAHKN